jgi:phosphatidylserine decarboxylase
MFRIHREGTVHTLAATILFVLIAWATLSWLIGHLPVIGIGLLILLSILWFWVLWFFRHPRRLVSPDDNVVLCPADGKVVVVEEVDNVEFLGDRRIQVSVFMSPLNVHCNRVPVSGVVVYRKYYQGKYLVAWHPKSSELNERMTIAIKHPKATIVVKQIAGAMARRIVNYLQEGQEVVQGNELGFIKFGSRVDVLLPLDCVLKVKPGDTVKANKTVIASFNN